MILDSNSVAGITNKLNMTSKYHTDISQFKVIYLRACVSSGEFEAADLDELNNPKSEFRYFIVSSCGAQVISSGSANYLIDLNDGRPAAYYYHTRSDGHRVYYIRGGQIQGKKRVKYIIRKFAELL